MQANEANTIMGAKLDKVDKELCKNQEDVQVLEEEQMGSGDMVDELRQRIDLREKRERLQDERQNKLAEDQLTLERTQGTIMEITQVRATGQLGTIEENQTELDRQLSFAKQKRLKTEKNKKQQIGFICIFGILVLLCSLVVGINYREYSKEKEIRLAEQLKRREKSQKLLKYIQALDVTLRQQIEECCNKHAKVEKAQLSNQESISAIEIELEEKLLKKTQSQYELSEREALNNMGYMGHKDHLLLELYKMGMRQIIDDITAKVGRLESSKHELNKVKITLAKEKNELKRDCDELLQHKEEAERQIAVLQEQLKSEKNLEFDKQRQSIYSLVAELWEICYQNLNSVVGYVSY